MVSIHRNRGSVHGYKTAKRTVLLLVAEIFGH